MPGINWKYDEDGRHIFWSTASDSYIALEPLFTEFDAKFGQKLGSDTIEFELDSERIDFLLRGIENVIDKLLISFDPNVKAGLTSVNTTYKGKQYDLFVKMSKSHQLIFWLVKLFDFIQESKIEKQKLVFYGGEMEE